MVNIKQTECREIYFSDEVPQIFKTYFNIMFKTIRNWIFAWRYKRAVKEAKELAALFGVKYYVLNLGGSLKVVPKKNIKGLIKHKKFRKGISVESIERMALFVTT